MMANPEACCDKGICTIVDKIANGTWSRSVLDVVVQRGTERIYETGESDVPDLVDFLLSEDVTLYDVLGGPAADNVIFYRSEVGADHEMVDGFTAREFMTAVATCLDVSRREGDQEKVIPCKILETI